MNAVLVFVLRILMQNGQSSPSSDMHCYREVWVVMDVFVPALAYCDAELTKLWGNLQS